MAEKKFNYADGWHPSGPGGKLEYWEKGKRKKPGTEALRLLKNVSSEADQLIGQPIREATTDVKNALGDVLKIGRYSGIVKDGKRLTVFEARRQGLLPNYDQQLGLMYRLRNLGKNPFDDPNHPDYKGSESVDEGYFLNGKWISTKKLNTGIGPNSSLSINNNNKNQKNNNNNQKEVNNNEAKGQIEVSNNNVDTTLQNNKTNKEKVEDNAAVTPSIERWTGRGSGRTRKQATEQSLAWLDQQGFDTTFLRKARHNQADLMEDLRIRGPYYTKNDKSMLRIGSGPDSILLKKIKNNNLKINKNNNQQIATPIIS
jgi:hypothetical protein